MSAEPMRGSVFCHECHYQIDLKVQDQIERMRWDAFRIEHCPHCKAFSEAYNEREVKPLATWKETAMRLEKRMDRIEKNFKDPHFLSDVAKAMMKLAEKQAKAERAKDEEGNPLAR
jgi:hypothetical protein